MVKTGLPHSLVLIALNSATLLYIVNLQGEVKIVTLLMAIPQAWFNGGAKPFKEDVELKPEGPYGQAKANAEDWCYQYNKYYKVPVVVVRYHHIVGPR